MINLSADKASVFSEIARVLKPGGVTSVQLPETVVCNSTLWAACIGGAMQQDDYRAAIEAAGLKIERIVENDTYQFISDNAKAASKKFGVKSVSLLAVKA